MKKLSLNKKLAVIAFILGFLSLFFGNPYKGNFYNLDAKELSLIVGKEVDHVKAEELAAWIIQGKSDFSVIDTRSEEEYLQYHIPGSMNIPVTVLEKAEFGKNDKLILYSEGGIHSAQAWMLLRAKGYKGVYILFGGLDEWNDKILLPKIPENATPEQLASFEKIKEISKFFGGTPQTGSATETKETPKIQAPKLEAPSNVPAPTGGTKKKEGC